MSRRGDLAFGGRWKARAADHMRNARVRAEVDGWMRRMEEIARVVDAATQAGLAFPLVDKAARGGDAAP